jgi:hypothetical protein
MFIGNASSWKNSFQTSEQRFTAKIAKHWPNCRELLDSSSIEDDITNNLVNLLCKDSEVRKLGWPEAQFVPFGFVNGSQTIKGKGFIDIALIIDGNREDYIAYECKRLNVINKGNRESLATKYVNEGLFRFIKQQYSSTLPLASMLGYVMDGDVDFALNKVHSAIQTLTSASNLKSGPISLPALGTDKRFKTIHERNDSSLIEVNHALLSF